MRGGSRKGFPSAIQAACGVHPEPNSFNRLDVTHLEGPVAVVVLGATDRARRNSKGELAL
jgi:hypothetical protein